MVGSSHSLQLDAEAYIGKISNGIGYHINQEQKASQVDQISRCRSRLHELKKFITRKPLGAIGGFLVIVIVVAAIFAPILAKHDPYKINSSVILVRPNHLYFLGTDEFGRDLFSRIIWGSRISLYVGFLAVAFGTTTGAFLGMISGYYKGRVDFIIQRIMDSLMAFPMLVLALAIVAALGQSTFNVIVALAVVIMPTAARVVRSSALAIRETSYIESARSVGCRDLRILMCHVLPNCLAPYIILVTAGLGNAILTEASLSFLGLGTPPPEPSWGAMLSGAAQRFVQRAPWMVVFPGAAITLAVFGFNFLGDALRDVLDPRLRRD